MDKDEALKMAIEALEDADTIITQRCRVLLDAIQPAINACKEALEQPAQEPIFWMHEVNDIPYENWQVTVSPEQCEYYTIPIYAQRNKNS